MANPALVITLHNGEKITVQPTLEDRLKFEQTLRRNKSWGTLKDNALTLHPFLGWSAATRAGHDVGTWQEFTTGETAAIDVEPVEEPEDDEEGEDLEVDGLGKDTRTEASTSSPSSSAGGSKSRRTPSAAS